MTRPTQNVLAEHMKSCIKCENELRWEGVATKYAGVKYRELPSSCTMLQPWKIEEHPTIWIFFMRT